jgi:hypothetical protein
MRISGIFFAELVVYRNRVERSINTFNQTGKTDELCIDAYEFAKQIKKKAASLGLFYRPKYKSIRNTNVPHLHRAISEYRDKFSMSYDRQGINTPLESLQVRLDAADTLSRAAYLVGKKLSKRH